jgi:hypothetical protein
METAGLAIGILSTLALVVLHHLIACAFPRPPINVLRSVLRAQRPPTEEEGDGLAAIYELDEALMQAERERPGSTFWLYYRQPGAQVARWAGSAMLSFGVALSLQGPASLSCGTLLLCIVGLGLSAYPYQTWWMSRPARRNAP